MRQLPCDVFSGVIKKIYQQILGLGLSRISLGAEKQFRIGIVDGSGFGKQYASVVMIAGARNFPLTAEVYVKYGKELSASRRALGRVTKLLGSGWCEILLGDELYGTREDFRRCREEYGCDLLVKAGEERLTIILSDAKGLIFGCLSDESGVEKVSGVDRNRCCEYEVRKVEGITWEGLAYPLAIAWVRETYLKPRPNKPDIEIFWVITTKQGLSCNDMRDLAHRRWQIENGFFKKLSFLVKSKKVYTHNASCLRSLLQMWIIGFCLFEAFLDEISEDDLRQMYGKVRITLGLMLEELRLSFLDLTCRQ